ncbi:MAG TPA: tripartite tricarboxylate transporter TctB family protein [Piscinibacter sp.]|jgi:putative tricarboxylic transport membrane protein|uniref:tripartite tricarboxylate transporter TctB family protein n=1 Tax=Piscinibacter sp. TaxID=1903157 RepID=UPI001B566B37|nr:tripartite tricarboxylate transporter TctB family protein [Piscinibacter sp.]MBK7530021.1 tripartite tricarboxylate transporter TctB family protein [Piscinibacter sp.]MBP6543667.1 tripartite tricarboxylate transporter TctB family protein [Piscinibacter sp.]HOY33817.1 tripartite tricarboxylate transporter TctB family protein [Piscinibacter sp.]HPG81238.1 tripartite tricarboxylate transporter TctB family protein [Piscinibacter sp.]HPM66653.1 tripartite tricarboxylate transporter TctB family p
MNMRQALVGGGTLVIGVVLVAGAMQISSEAGYGGVGPNFLPWVVGIALLACGAFLVWEASSGGYRAMETPSGAEHGHWPGFVWVSVAILVNAALITTIGFILSCALCFVLAVRGFKSAEGRLDLSPQAWLIDLAIGAAIAAPVYWMFTKLLAINLPGLTSTGWL